MVSFMISLFFWCRLQTGMRGAFGKPQGLVARVNIGETLMSVRSKDGHKKAVIEALRRSKMKFPGRQKVIDITCLLEQRMSLSEASARASCADLCVAPLGIHSVGPLALRGAALRGSPVARRRERQVHARARPSLQLACEPIARLVLNYLIRIPQSLDCTLCLACHLMQALLVIEN